MEITDVCLHCPVYAARHRRSGGVFSSPTLGDAIAAVLSAKTAANLRPVYIRSLRQYLSLFCVGREDTAISTIDVGAIERWFAGRKESPGTMASNVGRLGSLFGYAFRRGWIAINPIKQLERVRFDRKPPQILTPARAREIMRAAPVNCRAYLTLAMFVGVRPEEIAHLQWSQIDLARGIVRIDYSKTRRRRLVAMEANAVRWLATCAGDGRVAPSQITLKRMRRKLRPIMAEWPQDVLRHTAASYLIALHKDTGKVATLLGNSTAILVKHYHEPVTDEAAREFWSIAPPDLCAMTSPVTVAADPSQ